MLLNSRLLKKQQGQNEIVLLVRDPTIHRQYHEEESSNHNTKGQHKDLGGSARNAMSMPPTRFQCVLMQRGRQKP